VPGYFTPSYIGALLHQGTCYLFVDEGVYDNPVRILVWASDDSDEGNQGEQGKFTNPKTPQRTDFPGFFANEDAGDDAKAFRSIELVRALL
jgi:hypothetical protein